MREDSFPSLKSVAREAGVSPRSLQRHLAESGWSFSGLAWESRLLLARDLLSDRSVRTIDIAFELGYRDSGNFTRASRRWTGVSPTEFRRSQLGMGAGSR